MRGTTWPPCTTGAGAAKDLEDEHSLRILGTVVAKEFVG